MTWKTLILGGAALLALAASAHAAAPVAVEGGRLADAAGHRLELVTKGGKIDVLLSEHDNKPVPAAGWSGKVTVLTPSGKAEAPLTVVGGNRLSAALPPGAELAAAIVSLNHEGHPVNARFPALAAPAALDPAQVAEGKRLFTDMCASCHGDKLQGRDNWQQRGEDGLMPAPPLNETGHAWHHSDQAMFDVIKKGGSTLAATPEAVSGMPPFEGTLTDPQIQSVIAFVISTWPVATRAQQPKEQTAKPLGTAAAGHPAAVMPASASMPHAGHAGH